MKPSHKNNDAKLGDLLKTKLNLKDATKRLSRKLAVLSKTPVSKQVVGDVEPTVFPGSFVSQAKNSNSGGSFMEPPPPTQIQ